LAICVVQERNPSTARRPYAVLKEEHAVIYNMLSEIHVQDIIYGTLLDATNIYECHRLEEQNSGFIYGIHVQVYAKYAGQSW